MSAKEHVPAENLLEKEPVKQGIGEFIDQKFAWIESEIARVPDEIPEKFKEVSDPDKYPQNTSFIQFSESIQTGILNLLEQTNSSIEDAESIIRNQADLIAAVGDYLPNDPDVIYLYGNNRESLRGLAYLVENEIPVELEPSEESSAPLLIRKASPSVVPEFDTLEEIRRAAEALGNNYRNFKKKEEGEELNIADKGGEIIDLDEPKQVQAVVQRFEDEHLIARYNDNRDTVRVSEVDEPLRIGDKISVEITGYDDIREYGRFISEKSGTDVRWISGDESNVYRI